MLPINGSPAVYKILLSRAFRLPINGSYAVFGSSSSQAARVRCWLLDPLALHQILLSRAIHASH